jgi:hypothetical protein
MEGSWGILAVDARCLILGLLLYCVMERSLERNEHWTAKKKK